MFSGRAADRNHLYVSLSVNILHQLINLSMDIVKRDLFSSKDVLHHCAERYEQCR